MTSIKIGTILIAKEDRFMDGEISNPWIIKGNSYKIIRYRSHKDNYMIIDEQGDEHFIGMDYINQHFTIKRYTLTDLKERTDLMVRIESEEQAKKLQDAGLKFPYLNNYPLYGYEGRLQCFVWLDEKQQQGRTLIPSIDLIDLEVKEDVKLVESHHVKQLKSIDEIDLGEGKEARYFVDIRGGCGAVRDRLHKSYDKDYHGLHNDTTDVIEYRHGYQENGVWNMKSEDIQYLNDLCEKLNKNNILSNETVLIATDADCVERIQQLESEIARLKGELEVLNRRDKRWEEKYDGVCRDLVKKEDLITELRESSKTSQNQELTLKQRMAWELYVSGFNHGIADKWTIAECYRSANIFLNYKGGENENN